jgi:mycothiol synthase
VSAYGQASRVGGSWVLGLVTPDDVSTAAVLRELVAGVAALGGGRTTWWRRAASGSDSDAARAVGLTPGRELLQMRRGLPLPDHEPVADRPFRPGRDESAWLEVNNRAFADHDEQGGWTLETLELRLAEPWFDPDGLRLFEDDGRLLGFCWTKVHPARGDDPRLGEIYVIGVDPAAHGRGLGRRLTVAGLDHLASCGVGTAMLFVDAANDAATHLYDSLGFSVHHREHAFTGDIAPDTPLAAS